MLLAYFRKVADKHDLRPHIRFETTVEEAVFDEKAAAWRIEVKTAEWAREVLSSDVLITAVGQHNRPKYPDIEGVETFDGPSFHSARWAP